MAQFPPPRPLYYNISMEHIPGTPKKMTKKSTSNPLEDVNQADKITYITWGRQYLVMPGGNDFRSKECAILWHRDAIEEAKRQIDKMRTKFNDRRTTVQLAGGQYQQTPKETMLLAQMLKDEIQLDAAEMYNTYLLANLEA